MGGLIFSYFFLKMIFGVTYTEDITFIVSVSVQIILFVLVYYNLLKVVHFVERVMGSRLVGKFRNKLKSLDLYDNVTLNKVLVLSLVRSRVFQPIPMYYVFLGVTVSFINICAGISSYI
ncbi:MAG: hypothetical protein IPO92_02215 [Saprospiraceae bacterium]|nr:hypothetical protein [Saprospiraceae bacterium]